MLPYDKSLNTMGGLLVCSILAIVCGLYKTLVLFLCPKKIELKLSLLHKVCGLQCVKSVICSKCVHLCPANPRHANCRLGAGLPVCTMQGNLICHMSCVTCGIYALYRQANLHPVCSLQVCCLQGTNAHTHCESQT